MHVSQQQIVALARGWIGTRFRHQGRLKQCAAHRGGVDCLGLLIGVADEARLTFAGQFASALDDTQYGHFPDAGRLRAALSHYLQSKTLDRLQPADVLLLRVDGRAQHLALASEYPGGGLAMIHAYAPARAVVEHRLDKDWLSRVEAVFALASAESV